MTTHLLTVDLEEWYHPHAIRTAVKTHGVSFTRFSQVEAATLPLLALFEDYGFKATFFTVGEVLQTHPGLIEKILAAGHELAFHGWTHYELWELTPQTFAAEIEQFLKAVRRDFPGVPVLGYRAPTFSLDSSTAWAVKVLQEHGFRYDSSIFPARTSLYGVPGAPMTPYPIRADNLTGNAASGLLEIPMSVFPIAGQPVGFTGGLYLRALPLPAVKTMFRQRSAQNHPAMMYIHPWETYAATPRLPLPLSGRLILYTGLPALPKIRALLQNFRFGSIQEVILPHYPL